jgi:hypothetical protein
MGQVYQCWWRICRDINVFYPCSNITCVLYPFVTYLLTLHCRTLYSVQWYFWLMYDEVDRIWKKWLWPNLGTVPEFDGGAEESHGSLSGWQVFRPRIEPRTFRAHIPYKDVERGTSEAEFSTQLLPLLLTPNGNYMYHLI